MELAYGVVHDLCQILQPGCVPIFSSDGLKLYFYALTTVGRDPRNTMAETPDRRSLAEGGSMIKQDKIMAISNPTFFILYVT